jgi:hypothetical protein
VRGALQTLVRRQAVLRTHYAVRSGSVLQVVLPADGFVVPLNECTETDQVPVTQQFLATPFQLLASPPLRGLFMRSKLEHSMAVLLNIHHVATDYVSNSLIETEFSHACDTVMTRGATSPLPWIGVQYADFSVWHLGQSLERDVYALEWWRGKLHGIPQILELPLDKPRPPDQISQAGIVSVHVEPGTVLQMQGASRDERVTPLCAILVAWTTVMTRLSKQAELVLGQPQSVRNHAVFRALVGCFINTLPLRISIPLDASCRTGLVHTHRELLLALEHASTPFYHIVQAVKPTRSGGYNPIFQTVVQILPEAEGTDVTQNSAASFLMGIEAGAAVVDLWMNLATTSDGALAGHLMYDTGIFTGETAGGFVRDFEVVLAYAVTHRDAALSSLSPFHVDTTSVIHGLSASERSIESVLESLGLHQHLQDFLEEGFDHLDDLEALPKADLCHILKELGLNMLEADTLLEWLVASGTQSNESHPSK